MERMSVLALPAAALILEALPIGAVVSFKRQFADGTATLFRDFYSYFSPTPVEYGNWFPLAAAVLTCVLLVLLLIYTITGKRAVLVLGQLATLAAAVVSFLPLTLGTESYSLAGGLISLCLLAAFAINLYLGRRKA